MNIVTRTLHTRRSRGIAAGVVAVGVGAAAVVGGSAITASASQAAPADAPPCATSQLQVWLGVPGDASAGHVAYPLEFSNISTRTCSLYGYPGVTAVGDGGAQVGSPASRDAAAPKRTVTLVPGATAYVALQTTDTGVYSPSECDPKTAIGLRVYPPNTTVSTIVTYPVPACAKKGPLFLSVRVVVPGVGIPLFSV